MSTSNVRKLGKGLTSLLNTPVKIDRSVDPSPPLKVENPQAAIVSSLVSTERSISSIPLAQVNPNTNQPRKHFDAGSLERLAESIRSAGVMQPILIRRSPEPNQYEIVAGERRFRAAGLAGLSTIPAITVDINDEESAEWALIENMQRDDLAPMEKAWALRALAEKFNLTHAQIAEKVGLDRSSITNMIRLTELEPEIIALLDQRRLTFGHGKALLSCPAGPRRIEIARKAAEEEWSVRRLERAVAVIAATADRPATASSEPAANRRERALENEAGIRDLEQQLSEYLGTKVELAVSTRGDKGRVVISFFGLDHFDALMEKIHFRPK